MGDISRNLVGIYRALGGGWEIREGEDFVPEQIKAEDGEADQLGEPAQTRVPAPAELASGGLVRPPDW